MQLYHEMVSFKFSQKIMVLHEVLNYICSDYLKLLLEIFISEV